MASISYKAVLAEFMAMTLFVYIGCGTAVTQSAPKDWNFAVTTKEQAGLDQVSEAVDRFQANILTWGSWAVCTALAFGTAIMVLVYATAHHSGGHINCAVTLTLALSGACPPLQAIANVVAQLAGSVLGAGLLYATFPHASDSSLGANSLSPQVSVGNAFAGEIVMTYVLCIVVLETAVNTHSIAKNLAPVPIGFAVFCAHAVLLPIDGCSINPTRSFGPALVAGIWDNFYVFAIAPLIGSVLAAGTHYVFKADWDQQASAKAAEAPAEEPVKV